MFEVIPDFEQQAEAVFCSRKKVADRSTGGGGDWSNPLGGRHQVVPDTGHSGIAQEKLADTNIPSQKLTKH